MRASVVEGMARRFGGACARRIGAWRGREVGRAAVEEIVAIYRGELIQALAACDEVVRLDWRAPRHARGGRRTRHSFAARRAWVAAAKRAAAAAGQEVHHGSRIGDECAAMDGLVQLREWSAGNWGEARGWEVSESSALAREARRERAPRAGLNPRQVAHARECLIVHWSVAGGQRWRRALENDLALLERCALVAQGMGSACLGDWAEGEWKNSAARREVRRLRERLASGDALMTDEPERAEEILSIARRAWEMAEIRPEDGLLVS